MKKRNVWMTALLLLLSLCLAVALVGCFDDEDDDGSEGGAPEKGFTISCPTEMLAGERVEITITKIGDVELRQNNYEWKIVGENTVEGSFESEDLDKDDDYTNQFFKAEIPGTVQIQAVNKSDETYTSNIVEITVKGRTIASVQDLLDIAGSDKAYVLAADLDLSHENNWEPIQGFTGVLDGNGHKISNLVMNNFVSDLGLFGVLEGTVKNLTIEGVQITAHGDAGNAGAVAGTNKGTISGVTVKGSVSPEYYSNVGGVVGFNDGGKILNCVNEATVKGKDNVGGVVGKMVINENNDITGCQNKGAVTGKNSVGGVMGLLTSFAKGGDPVYTVSNLQNDGTVVGQDNVGGVIGEVFGIYQDGTWDYYSYFALSVLTNNATVNGSSVGSNAGGLIGKGTRLNSLSSGINKGDVTGGVCVGGQIGYSPDTNIKATGADNNNTITGTAKVGGFAGHAGVIEDAKNNGTIICTGSVVEEDKSCAYVGGIAGYCTGVIGCENNADISITSNGAYVGGIAGYVKVVENDKVNNNINYGKISGKNQVGGIIGYLTSTMESLTELVYTLSNNENKGAVTGDSQVGGIFGEVLGERYYSNGWSRYYYSYFSMIALSNSAPVTGSATGEDVGGLIGKATRLKVLSAGENTANVTGGSYVGGFVGQAPDANIKATGAINTKVISGKYMVGGFAGKAGLIEYATNRGTIVMNATHESGESYIGGIAGYCSGVVGCKNYSDIEIENAGKYIGGIAGYINNTATNTVNDNENYGAIKASANVGGIAGYMTMPTSQENLTYVSSNNKNAGAISGTFNVGGIFGEVVGMFYNNSYCGYFEVVNCRNEAEVTGTGKFGGIVGAYTRMKTDDNVMNTNTTTHGDKLGQ